MAFPTCRGWGCHGKMSLGHGWGPTPIGFMVVTEPSHFPMLPQAFRCSSRSPTLIHCSAVDVFDGPNTSGCDPILFGYVDGVPASPDFGTTAPHRIQARRRVGMLPAPD